MWMIRKAGRFLILKRSQRMGTEHTPLRAASPNRNLRYRIHHSFDCFGRKSGHTAVAGFGPMLPLDPPSPCRTAARRRRHSPQARKPWLAGWLEPGQSDQGCLFSRNRGLPGLPNRTTKAALVDHPRTDPKLAAPFRGLSLLNRIPWLCGLPRR